MIAADRPRYAVYFAPPPGHPLWRFGSAVIGYDAASGSDVPLAPPDGIDADHWADLTGEPRRYGFHATLKAPFEPAEGVGEARLVADVRALAAGLGQVMLPGLEVAAIGRFVALVPRAPCAALQALAAQVVEDLDHLRAPLGEADRDRRLRAPLTARQLAYLDRYGYPYVREEFRFHMTLTGPLADDVRPAVVAALARSFAAADIGAPPEVAIDALVVFKQEARRGRFRIIARAPLQPLPAA